mmetsp:Transcript_341/g.768  ORF Transcript_341/g.768 Transcript_341/m.768 type:complete len:287 (+) Transcript_341:472-1332(+)
MLGVRDQISQRPTRAESMLRDQECGPHPVFSGATADTNLSSMNRPQTSHQPQQRCFPHGIRTGHDQGLARPQVQCQAVGQGDVRWGDDGCILKLHSSLVQVLIHHRVPQLLLLPVQRVPSLEHLRRPHPGPHQLADLVGDGEEVGEGIDDPPDCCVGIGGRAGDTDALPGAGRRRLGLEVGGQEDGDGHPPAVALGILGDQLHGRTVHRLPVPVHLGVVHQPPESLIQQLLLPGPPLQERHRLRLLPQAGVAEAVLGLQCFLLREELAVVGHGGAEDEAHCDVVAG